MSGLCQPVVTVTSLDEERVYLIPSTSPEFAAALDEQRDRRFDVLLPYAALLVNKSDRRIIAYSVRWIITDEHGRTLFPELTRFDFSSLRSPTTIPAQTSRLVANVEGLGSRQLRWQPFQETAEELLALFQKQRTVVVSLEAVAFEDGTATGPDRNHWIPRWKAHIDADREVYGTVSRSGAGSAVRDVLRGFTETAFARARPFFQDEHRDRVHLNLAANRAVTYEECYVLVRGIFADQLLETLQQKGEEAMLQEVREFNQSRQHPSIHRKEF